MSRISPFHVDPIHFSAIFGGFRGGSFEYAYARVNRAIRRDLLTSLVHQEVAFYDAHKTGEWGGGNLFDYHLFVSLFQAK